MIHPLVRQHFPDLNTSQLDAIDLTDGPLLIIAGPDSGKTLVLVMRALNILLLEKAQPKELVLCTFTEKAAFELRDHLFQAARAIGYNGDLSQLQVGTIHSLNNRYITRFRLHTGWGSGAEVLDELTRALNKAVEYWNKHAHPYTWKKQPQVQTSVLGGFGVHIRSNNLFI